MKTQANQKLRSSTAFQPGLQPAELLKRKNTSQPTTTLFNRFQPGLQPAELLRRNTSQPPAMLFNRLQPCLQPAELLGRTHKPTNNCALQPPSTGPSIGSIVEAKNAIHPKTLPYSTAFNRAFNRLSCSDEHTIQSTITINNRLQPCLQPAGLLWRKHKSTDNCALQPPSTGPSTG